MGISEMSNLFDLLFNNITSNQAPGLNEWEKSLFLTEAQDDIIRSHFSPKSNIVQEGYDDSAGRQTDFSMITVTKSYSECKWGEQGDTIDSRSRNFLFPDDSFFVINEVLRFKRYDGEGNPVSNPSERTLQVRPVSFDRYTEIMQKPYKYPLKNQAWRLLNRWQSGNTEELRAEIVLPSDADAEFYNNIQAQGVDDSADTATFLGDYTVRYVRYAYPIILGDFSGYEGYSIRGENTPLDSTNDRVCELDPSIHGEIVQRAVELAKRVWESQGNGNK